MAESFFGLTPEIRPELWTEYFFLVEYGNLPFETVWKMPIYDRRWWVEKLIDKFEKQREAQEQANSGKKKQDPETMKRAFDLMNKVQSSGSGGST